MIIQKNAALIFCLTLISAVFPPMPAVAQPNPDRVLAANDVFDMSLQQLMQLEVMVISPSKRPQKLSDTASAVYVVTAEDIRRSGVTNVPEALRLAPGVYVAKRNQTDYIVSVRGLEANDSSGSPGMNKLLVLVDGRSIYSPVYGGVNWQAQDFMMEDIDRIEVIRGAGGSLWGSNAVAGVINIITKSAKDTQGALVSAMAGTAESGTAARWGGKAGENFDYRVYGKYRDQNPGVNSNNANAYDARQLYQGGFRSEWQSTEHNHFTLQGDGQQANVQTDWPSVFTSYSPPYNSAIRKVVPYTSGNVLGRWDRALDGGGALKLQMYYDQARWQVLNSGIMALNTVDVEFQHNVQFWEWNNAAWGVNYRNADFNTPPTVNFNFPRHSLTLASFFVHDEITLLPKTWSVILGSKFENNSYTGMEIQPNARTVWTPHPNHTFWAAVSRAVRIPEMVTRNFNFALFGIAVAAPPVPPLVASVPGNGTARSETVLAYEAGYRLNAIPEKLSFDLALFADKYSDLIQANGSQNAIALGTAPTGSPIPVLLAAAPWANDYGVRVYGGELSGEWKVLDNWRLTGSYSYKSTACDCNPAVLGGAVPYLYTQSPKFMVKGRSYLTLPYDLEFDSTLSYQDQYLVPTDAAGTTFALIPGYAQLDLRLGWKPIQQLEVSLEGQNLLRDHHPEAFDTAGWSPIASETPRAFLGKVTWRY